MFEIVLRVSFNGLHVQCPCQFDGDLIDADLKAVLRAAEAQFLFAQNLLTKKIEKEAQCFRQAMLETEKEKQQ